MIALVALAVVVFAALVALARRGSRLPATVRIVRPDQAGDALHATGEASSVQAADLEMAERSLIELWSPAALERLARTYWRFLERCTLGLIRVRYSDQDRAIVIVCRPFVLLGFDPPEYELEPDRGLVRWRIRRGALVARRQPGGALEIAVRRGEPPAPGLARLHVELAVRSYRPAIARIVGLRIYSATQAAIHRAIAHAFLRSLARMDLARSRTGRFDAPAP